jgi:hypothetical protein
MKNAQNKLVLVALLTLSVGSLYPYYRSINSRSVAGDFFIGLILWGAVKGLQLFPSIVADGSSQYLVVLAALAVDGAICHATYKAPNLSNWLLLGASLLAPLLSMRVARRIGVIRTDAAITPSRFDSVTARAVAVPNTPVSNGSNKPGDPISNRIANYVRSGDGDGRSSESLLSILTKTPVSTILVGEPGTGKTMTGSSMGRQWVNDGHHVYYIDGKADPKELNLWEDACSDRYQFDGTLIRDPSEWCRRMIEAFDDFEDFRLRHLNDGKQTIVILDELPAVMAAFKGYKPDPAAALNFINRIVNTLPSRNCHILLLSQNPSCTDTIPSGTIGTLKKIILAKSGSESQLAEWSSLTMMRSVRMDTLSAAIRKSPVGRGCYYSVPGEWIPMDSWIRAGDYNRDTLSGGIPSQNQNFQNMPRSFDGRRYNEGSDAVVTDDLTDSDGISDAILTYFDGISDGVPRTIELIRNSRRLTNIRAGTADIQNRLDRLTAIGQLIRTEDGWILPD